MIKCRNSNVEIVRILSIFLIVISHYTVFNGIDNGTLSLGVNRFILEMSTLGNIGSILFVLITGYFGIKQTKISFKKIFMLIFEILFYTIGIYFIFFIFGNIKLNFMDFIRSFLPITFKTYWFMTTYIVLCLFVPYINKLLVSLNKKQFNNMLTLGIILFSIVPTLTTKDFFGNELIQFFVFYSIGAYLNLFNIKINKKTNFILFIILAFLIILSIVIIDLLSIKYPFLSNKSTYFLKRNSILTIGISVIIFNNFINKEFKNINFINNISKNVLAVYLISDNFLVRRVIWTDIFKCYKYVNSNYLLMHMLLSVIIIFCVCVLIEKIRLKIFNPIGLKIYSFLSKINIK